MNIFTLDKGGSEMYLERKGDWNSLKVEVEVRKTLVRITFETASL